MLSKRRTHFFSRLVLAMTLVWLGAYFFQATHRHSVGEHSGNWENSCTWCQYGNALTSVIVAAPLQLFHGARFVVSLLVIAVAFVTAARSSAFARAPPSLP